MKAKNAPRNAKSYNLGLKAYSKLWHMGAMLTAYKDMITDQIEPDVETYREDSLHIGSVKVTRWTVYILWRFVKEVPRIIQILGSLTSSLSAVVFVRRRKGHSST